MHDFFTKTAGEHLQILRKERPLIHNITNFVVMNVTANALLALGASPVMAHALEEAEEVVGVSDALVLNIGSIDLAFAKSMQCALGAACTKNIPVVIDPVGVGISSLRYEVVSALLAQANKGFMKNVLTHNHPNNKQHVSGIQNEGNTQFLHPSFDDEKSLPYVVRGNASEIITLGQKCAPEKNLDSSVKGKGVDSTEQASSALPYAKKLSTTYNCIVSISGATDYIVSPKGRVAMITGGSELMPKITGMGCVATAITAACVAVAQTPFLGAVSAMAFMAESGALAAKKTESPGSFLPFFIDALYTLQVDALFKECRIEVQSY